MKTIQKNEFRFVGLSRSGNHGIINWLISQIEERYCFLNCAEPKYNPYLTARPLKEEGKVYQTNISNFNLEKEQKKNFSEKDYLLYNHEDCFLGPLNNKIQQEDRQKWVGLSKNKRDILILRDPFNLFASRIKAGLIRGHYTHHGARPISTLTLKRIYKQHAREFLGEKNYLKNKLPVKFNSWTSDKEYRRKITEELDLTFTDKGFKEVSVVAGGSSFDGVKLSGRANQMSLNSRWRKFAHDEEYWSLFDEEMVELAQKIFGDIEPVQYYLKNKGGILETKPSSEEDSELQ